MTDTITADPGHGTDSQDGAAGGTIEHLDPHNLEVGDNVREYANLNKSFLDSIAEHGVLTPITAIRRADGVVEVRNGQRRTMAARKLGLSSVPVYVLPATAADTAAETIDRIVHQIVTNDHKSELTDAQRAWHPADDRCRPIRVEGGQEVGGGQGHRDGRPGRRQVQRGVGSARRRADRPRRGRRAHRDP
jgi:hypothetical protein